MDDEAQAGAAPGQGSAGEHPRTDAPPPADESGETQFPVARILISTVLVLLFLALGVGAFLGLESFAKDAAREAAPPPRTAVRVERAVRTSFEEQLTGYGKARALRSADVAAEIHGVVVWVAPELEAGNHVEAGTELVRLDLRDVESAAAAARARLQRADAALVRIGTQEKSTRERLQLGRQEVAAREREVARTEDLVGSGASESEADRERMQLAAGRAAVATLEGQLETFGAERQSAEADQAAAAADLTRAQTDLLRGSVKAPYSGVIDARHAELGAHIGQGASLFRIVDLSRVEVPITLPASRFGEVRVGTRASLRLQEGGKTIWTGTVARISATVNPDDRTFRAFLVVESEPTAPLVPPGAFVVADLVGRTTDDVFVVPRSSLVEGRVFVVQDVKGDEGRIAARTPVVQRLLPGVVLIESGLEAGDLLVVTNVEQVADGTTVRVVHEDAAQR